MTEFVSSAANSDDSRCFDAAPSDPCPLPHPPTNPTRSFWLATSSPPAEASPAPEHPGPGTIDVAIIGSGITGISAVYHLVHSDELPASVKSIAVFEARDFCSGATGRNGGHLTPASALAFNDLAADEAYLNTHIDAIEPSSSRTPADVIRRILTLEAKTAFDITEIVEKAKIAAASESAEQSGRTVEDVELVNQKNWHLCFTAGEEAGFEASLAAASDAGLVDFVQRIRKVSKEECDRTLEHPVGVHCAYEIPGGTVHPRRLVTLFWRLAHRRALDRKLSLKLYTHTPIESLTSPHGSSSHPTELHTTAGATFRARYVIHATNAYVSHLAPQLSGPTSPSGPHLGVVSTRAQCIAALPTSQARHWPMGFSLHDGFEYLHQRPVRSASSSTLSASAVPPPPLIFGGGRYLSDSMEYGISDDGAVHPTISHFLRSFLVRTWPGIFPSPPVSETPTLAPVSHEWTGIIGMTRSKNPLVGPLPAGTPPFSSSAATTSAANATAVPGQYVAAGYSGHGMTRAFACARIVVDMLLADANGRAEQWTVPEWFPACYLTMLPGRGDGAC
ncbi:hypothetical protein OC835_000351 [Tilletia horrida]|nr:hypothetical protein OC835_000351 [Tilletia horrida]